MHKFYCPHCSKPNPIQWCMQHGDFYSAARQRMQQRTIDFRPPLRAHLGLKDRDQAALRAELAACGGEVMEVKLLDAGTIQVVVDFPDWFKFLAAFQQSFSFTFASVVS